MSNGDPRAELVDQLAEEFLTRYRRGERPAVHEYTDRYPDYAAQIRDLFPALVVLEQVAPASDSGSASPVPAPPAVAAVAPAGQLGDYRIVREIGRGGMGVVYEAEQQALGRPVALKVLLRPAAQDAKVLARFRRESRAAAQLHHSNIVPVFDVGQQGDVCYYAMQFIRGQALDQVFRELQRLRAGPAPGTEGRAEAGPLAQSLWTGRFELAGSACATVDPEPGPAAGIPEPAPRPAETTAAALPDRSELSSVTSNYQRYCRNVARLGLQAAQALAYAHGRGIIHRDIKPANLLLDTTGVLWVSDFGLVKTQDPALTDTGDLVGTVRYMAPERFRGECDPRADVYALGLTLYELLVLRPAFDGQDRLQLVEQIGRQEPVRLRVLDPRIPRDLETILMKTIEKDRRWRYASADDLAEDLCRYLADEPIRARRIGPVERLGRWGRRNPVVAGLTAAIVLVTACGFAATAAQTRAAQIERDAAQQQRDDAQRQRDEVRALAEKLQATQAELRNTLYAARMNLAKHAWDEARVPRVLELLDQQRPKPGEPDLRHFEWHYLHRLCHSELLTFKGHTDEVTSVAFSPDGKRLASASGTEVKVWDAQTGQELFPLKGHIARVNSVAFSPDGKRLASAARGPWAGRANVPGEVKVWDAQTGQELLNLTAFVHSVAFSPDGKRLAGGSTDRATQDGTVKVWDAQTGQELIATKELSNAVYSVTFSPDGKRLAGSSWDSTVKVWDAQTGRELLTLKGHADYCFSVAFSPDGKRLANAVNGKGGAVEVWDAQTGQELLNLKGGPAWVNTVVFSPDGKRLTSAWSDGMVKVWDAQTGQVIRTFYAHNGNVTSAVFSPDGQRLASSSADKTVKVWDAQRDPEALTLNLNAQAFAFSPDFRRLAIAASDNTVKVCDARTGQELFPLKGHTAPVWSLAFSPDGKRLASGAGGAREPGGSLGFSIDPLDRAELKVWHAQTGQELRTFPVPLGAVLSVAFSPDGKRLATAIRGVVKVWDAQTGQELLSLKGGGGRVAFSPDGKRLASGSKVWDAQTGQELVTLQGGSGGKAFSPDGKRLASAGGGGVRVWDAQTGQELLALKGGGQGVAFSPDGHRLASGGTDGTVKIWVATPLPEKTPVQRQKR